MPGKRLGKHCKALAADAKNNNTGISAHDIRQQYDISRICLPYGGILKISCDLAITQI